MVIIYDSVYDGIVYQRRKNRRHKKSKKTKEDWTKSRVSRLNSKANRYCQQESFKFKAMIEEDQECILQTNKKTEYLVEFFDPTNALINVLVESCGIVEVSNKEEQLEVARRLIWDHAIDLNHPEIIQKLYTKSRSTYEHCLYPVEEIKLLLQCGANPTKLLVSLWKKHPLLNMKDFLDFLNGTTKTCECEVSVLVDGGANLKSREAEVMLADYIAYPWESAYKSIVNPTFGIMDDYIIRKMFKAIEEAAASSDPYTLDYMISNGLDPNQEDGYYLLAAISNYLFLMGQTLKDVFLYRNNMSVFEELNMYKLSLLTVCIMIRRCAFKYVQRAYMYCESIDPMVESDLGLGHAPPSQAQRNQVKMIIDVFRPCVPIKRDWAARVIQRGWRRANCDPTYAVCCKRIYREFEEIVNGV